MAMYHIEINGDVEAENGNKALQLFLEALYSNNKNTVETFDYKVKLMKG